MEIYSKNNNSINKRPNNQITINNNILKDITSIIKKETKDLKQDIIFPELNDSERISNALGLYSSINHRFWVLDDKGFKPIYYKTKEGEYIKGSSFLDSSFRKMMKKNPEFFATDNLIFFDLDSFHELFGENIFPDEAERYKIMNDFIDKTIRQYEKSLNQIWYEEAKEDIEGLHKILNETFGMKDSLQKKTQMFVKFMNYQKEWLPKDKEKVIVPMDYHLMNIAVKTGLLDINDNDIKNKLVKREPLTEQESNMIREKGIEAYKSMKKDGIDTYLLDDLLWATSRMVCQNIDPDCLNCPFNTICLSNNINSDLKKSFPIVYTNAF